jgi:hypothetical protein
MPFRSVSGRSLVASTALLFASGLASAADFLVIRDGVTESSGDTQAILSGRTFAFESISGTDAVNTELLSGGRARDRATRPRQGRLARASDGARP